jgi:hypothetical protein
MMPEPPGCGPYPSARGRRARSTIREYPPERRPLKSETAAVIATAAAKSKAFEFLLLNQNISPREFLFNVAAL